jgi:hypothetical protein
MTSKNLVEPRVEHRREVRILTELIASISDSFDDALAQVAENDRLRCVRTSHFEPSISSLAEQVEELVTAANRRREAVTGPNSIP